ncbi:MAG: alginate lyase family protein [Pseudomonadota bacterium]|nr:alginate lyase family protein [Pseudomonadota bacterium]
MQQAFALNPNADIWISLDELSALEMSGEAWQRLKKQAKAPGGTPLVRDQNQNNDVYTLAKALVYARCSLSPSHAECRDVSLSGLNQEITQSIMGAIGTESGGLTLALGRNLTGYVIAADLVGLPSTSRQAFKSWLQSVRHKLLDGRTLITTHEQRANNWGTHAGASRAAIAVYLQDFTDLGRTATVFKGYLGDRSAYTGFSFGDLDWQCDPARPVPINPKGCTKNGRLLDGVLPDDQRRAGSFTWPPPQENYVWEGLQGAIVEAVILHRAGYDVFNWQDKALLRAYQWLHNVANFPAEGDDTWQVPLVDHYYGTAFWDGDTVREGKNMGWTDWTHSGRSSSAGTRLSSTTSDTAGTELAPPSNLIIVQD